MRGGRRPGAGRKAGEAWKPCKPAPVRDMARARVREVLTTAQDPIAVLVEIANDRTVDVQVRVQAATSAAPFIFPRLSAAVVASAAPIDKEDNKHLIDRIMGRLERMQPSVVEHQSADPAPV